MLIYHTNDNCDVCGPENDKSVVVHGEAGNTNMCSA